MKKITILMLMVFLIGLMSVGVSAQTFSFSFGTNGIGDGQFQRANDVALDSAGNIYVADEGFTSANHRVQKFDSSGNFLLKFGSFCRLSTGGGCVDPDGPGPLELGDGEFKGPEGVAVDNAGNIFVVDRENHRVQKFDSFGNFLLKFGSSCRIADGAGCVDPDGAGPLELGDGQFFFPTDVAFDAAGNMFVADSGNARIQVFNPSGTLLFKFGSLCFVFSGFGCVDPDGPGPLELGDGQFTRASDVTVDGAGNIYVSDSGSNSRIQKFDSSGNFLLKFGSFCQLSTGAGCVDPDGAGPLELGDVQFLNPDGVAVDGVGNIYVAEFGNHRIQKFDSSGNFLLKFGILGSANGQFRNPRDVEVDSAGNIYVADTSAFRIQVFVPTVCGNNVVEISEECDDGNLVNGDGCNTFSANCQHVCGDGSLDAGEVCDDGNLVNGDGCDEFCALEQILPGETVVVGDFEITNTGDEPIESTIENLDGSVDLIVPEGGEATVSLGETEVVLEPTLEPLVEGDFLLSPEPTLDPLVDNMLIEGTGTVTVDDGLEPSLESISFDLLSGIEVSGNAVARMVCSRDGFIVARKSADANYMSVTLIDTNVRPAQISPIMASSWSLVDDNGVVLSRGGYLDTATSSFYQSDPLASPSQRNNCGFVSRSSSLMLMTLEDPSIGKSVSLERRLVPGERMMYTVIKRGTNLFPARGTRLIGSELMIYEPLEVYVSGGVDEVPFVFDTPDTYWTVDSNFIPPTGCTVDYSTQSVTVSEGIEASVFSMTCSSNSITGAAVVNVAEQASDRAKAVHTARDCTRPGCPPQQVTSNIGVNGLSIAATKAAPQAKNHAAPLQGAVTAPQPVVSQPVPSVQEQSLWSYLVSSTLSWLFEFGVGLLLLVAMAGTMLYEGKRK